MTLSSVIKELEQAQGPSRELDDAVLLACGWKTEPGELLGLPITNWVSPTGSVHWRCDVPNPTSSLDAAMSLVPEGHFWSCGGPDETLIRRPKPWAQVWRGKQAEDSGEGPTPAIALCIAALKARSVMEEGK